jgi:hypothetical protein
MTPRNALKRRGVNWTGVEYWYGRGVIRIERAARSDVKWSAAI